MAVVMCRHRDTDYTSSSLDVIENRAVSDYLLLQFLLLSALLFTLSIVYVLLNVMHLAGSPTHLRHVRESPAPDMALRSLLARFLLILSHPFRMPSPACQALLSSQAQPKCQQLQVSQHCPSQVFPPQTQPLLPVCLCSIPMRSDCSPHRRPPRWP